MELQIIKRNPPTMKWMPIESGNPKWGAQLVFALINQGTPHECHQVTILQYDAELKKWRDSYGDIDENSIVTHFLVEYGFRI